ncbi:MAG: component of SufBCD complex [Yoonia sp.]|nr:component of SufBCD complex [Yoonia sp.]
MDWNNAILHVINLRSFSSIWYWIMVAVVWSTASHWVLGVPFDMIQRAKRHGGQAELHLVDMVRINVNRQLTTAAVAGVWLIGILFFALSTLAGLGFIYNIEMAQAIFLLAFPISIIGAISVSTSRLIVATNPEGDALHNVLMRHRIWTQIIGMIAIFVTGLYGMFHNLAVVRGL